MAALLFFLYYSFLANLDYILNIFLDKNVFSRDQRHFAAERTVTHSRGLLFPNISNPNNSVITAGLPQDEKNKKLGTVLNCHLYHTSLIGGNR